jgi:tRNA-dihydrouridine synthase B
MGCPVKKVVSCGGGSNVLRSPTMVRDIVRTVRKRTSLPFSVKFRSGWDSKLVNYEEIAKIYEDEGVDFIMLHARTRAEAFGGRAHWDHIKRLKEVVKIPVIGNGDVISYESAKSLFEQTNCDGIGIGRGAIGNPWLYLQADRAIRMLPPLPEPSLDERLDVIFRHYDYVADYYGLQISSHIFRKHLVGYLRGLPNHKAIKEKLFLEEPLTPVKLREILGEYFELLRQTPFAA